MTRMGSNISPHVKENSNQKMNMVHKDFIWQTYISLGDRVLQ